MVQMMLQLTSHDPNFEMDTAMPVQSNHCSNRPHLIFVERTRLIPSHSVAQNRRSLHNTPRCQATHINRTSGGRVAYKHNFVVPKHPGHVDITIFGPTTCRSDRQSPFVMALTLDLLLSFRQSPPDKIWRHTHSP
jgi:hypothetical protein